MVFCGVSLAGAWCGIGFSLGFFELLRLSPLVDFGRFALFGRFAAAGFK